MKCQCIIPCNSSIHTIRSIHQSGRALETNALLLQRKRCFAHMHLKTVGVERKFNNCFNPFIHSSSLKIGWNFCHHEERRSAILFID